MANTSGVNLHTLNGEYFVLGYSFHLVHYHVLDTARFESGKVYVFCLLVFIVFAVWNDKAKVFYKT